jgi:hypothetical protein
MTNAGVPPDHAERDWQEDRRQSRFRFSSSRNHHAVKMIVGAVTYPPGSDAPFTVTMNRRGLAERIAAVELKKQVTIWKSTLPIAGWEDPFLIAELFPGFMAAMWLFDPRENTRGAV